MIFKAHQSPLGQGVIMMLTPMYLYGILVGILEPFRSWRSSGLQSLMPLVACLSVWYGSMPIGGFLQRSLFDHNFRKYQAIVDSIQTESLPNGTKTTIQIRPEDIASIHHVFAQRIDGVLVVEIDTEHGFPVKHSGYIYPSSGVFPDHAKFHNRWPYVDEVRPKWFRVSN